MVCQLRELKTQTMVTKFNIIELQQDNPLKMFKMIKVNGIISSSNSPQKRKRRKRKRRRR